MSWIPGDDVIDGGPDKQILVSGATIPGRLLTLLLDRAGYDPVFVTGTNASPDSSIAHLWPSVLKALEVIDLSATVLEPLVPVERVRVHDEASPTATSRVLAVDPDGATAPPALVETATLTRAIDSRLSHRHQPRDRDVAAVTTRRDRDGLAVEFHDGVREWFDVVVDAGGGIPSLHASDHERARDRLQTTTYTQYELVLDTRPVESDVTDVWGPEALVQLMTRPSGEGSLLRVTSPRSQPPDSGTWLPPSGELPGRLSAETLQDRLATVAADPVDQTDLASATPPSARWRVGEVGFCGSGAVSGTPATGAAVSLGIEDALALVAELTRERRPVSDAVAAYAARRRTRLDDVRRAVARARSNADCPTPTEPSQSLSPLGVFRAAALQPFLEGPIGGL